MNFDKRILRGNFVLILDSFQQTTKNKRKPIQKQNHICLQRLCLNLVFPIFQNMVESNDLQIIKFATFTDMLITLLLIMKRIRRKIIIWRVQNARRKSMKLIKMNISVKLVKNRFQIVNLFLWWHLDSVTEQRLLTLSFIKTTERIWLEYQAMNLRSLLRIKKKIRQQLEKSFKTRCLSKWLLR